MENYIHRAPNIKNPPAAGNNYEYALLHDLIMHQTNNMVQIPRQRRSMLIVFRDTSDNCTPPPLVDVKTYWEKREYFQNLVTTHNVQWFAVVGIIFLRHYNSLAVDSNCSFSSFIEFGITQSRVPDYANSYGEVQTGSGPDFPNVNYGVKIPEIWLGFGKGLRYL